MSEAIDIMKLNPEQHQALVCMFFAMLPKTDRRYKKRKEYWEILQARFNKKINTYKNAKDTFDFYFPNNNRSGWSDERALSRRGVEFQNIYDMYGEYDVDVIEKAVDEIITFYSKENVSFISMKCGFPDTVHAMLDGEKNITIDGVYTLQEELINDRIVFVTLGGDRGKKEVDWQPGFYGIAHIVKPPYDFGYNNNDKYFKFDICMDCTFARAYRREEFLGYRDAFDATYIGPELSRDPSQAISSLDDTKAVAVVRAIIDKQPELKEEISKIFSKEFMDRVLGAVRILIPSVAEYGESIEDAFSTFKSEKEAVQENEFIAPVFDTKLETEFERNRIVFGAPGTGKSFKLKEDSVKLLEPTAGTLERVTFHPDYTYAQFVGTYKPVSDANGDIRYKFVPGPFMRIYVDALKSGRTDVPQPHILLIEEINRARVAAVFGDVFQLLDRNEKGVSDYDIQATEDVRKYLADELGGSPDNYDRLQLPNNLFIWATMNSADQGVFPMDTAFKRRWNFEYIGINDSEEKLKYEDGKDYVIPIGMQENRKYVKWNDLRTGINEILTDTCKVNEDKLLGPFFISKDMLENALISDKREDSFVKAFESKVIMYLFEDVMKMSPEKIFKGHFDKHGKKIYSDICNTFESDGISVFGLDIKVSDTKELD